MAEKEERSYKDYLGIPDLAGDYFILEGDYTGEGKFPVYLPAEFEVQLRPFDGYIRAWDGLWTQWPEVQTDDNVPERDFRQAGYGSMSIAPLHRVILHLILGITQDEMQQFFSRSKPADGLPTNLTLDNVLLLPKGEEQYLSLRQIYNLTEKEKDQAIRREFKAEMKWERMNTDEKLSALDAQFEQLLGG